MRPVGPSRGPELTWGAGHDVPWVVVAGEARIRHIEAAKAGKCGSRYISYRTVNLTLLCADVNERYYEDYSAYPTATTRNDPDFAASTSRERCA